MKTHFKPAWPALAAIALMGCAALPVQGRCSDGGARPLNLDEQVRATRCERQGLYTDGSVTLKIESVHRLRGSPLPLEQAGGCVLSHQGQPVAGRELLYRAPRLRAGERATAVSLAVRDAAMPLALHRDPTR